MPALLIAAVVIIAIVVARIRRKLALVPSPRLGGPVLGNAAAYATDPAAAVSAAEGQCGPIFSIQMLFLQNIWLRSNVLNKFYVNVKEDAWSFGWGMNLFLHPVVAPGYWDHLRTLVGSLNRCINRSEALDCYAAVARDEAVAGFAQWAHSDDTALFESASVLVHKVIVRCLMGPDFYYHNVDELSDLLHKVEADIGSIFNFVLPHWVPHPAAKRLWKARDRMQDIFRERLRERALDPSRWTNSEDYVSHTLRDRMTAHLQDFFPAHHTVLMFAAHTSTVASVSWTIAELIRSPERLAILRKELLETSDVHSSPLLQACFKETGRHYSGINMLRLARSPVTIPDSNVVVPAGAVVSISPYLTHHDPHNYYHATEWFPERWLEGGEQFRPAKSADEVTYLGFGAGSHRCPGEKMAGTIAREVVGELVRNYDFGWGASGPPKDFGALDFTKIGSPWLKGDAHIRITSMAKQ
ncbi:hypothetical protein H2201_000153 [Coniosporium apollinis]|uniref:Cytochrome P450 n=1 Tax=Coniosporium apollinis TaxID=61459 RepID=A0ABQ9P6S8_9PEZI|nr:hypothetical protein H2201_000153 [Coniosporium apollinis]